MMRAFRDFRSSLCMLAYLLWIQITCRPTECKEWDDLTLCYAGYRNLVNQEHEYCGKIQSITKNRIRCVYAIDRLRCMEQLLAGHVDVGVFTAEDLFLASQLDNASVYHLVITNEFRTFTAQEHEFDMVTLVSNNREIEINSLSDLRGKRLCHPGFDEHGWFNDLSEMFLQYFEETVVPEQCNPNLSVLENKVNSSEAFFDSSCKPGPWSPDTSIDKKLKSRYSRLCDMCNNPSQCSHADSYWGPQGALTCMLDCHGDVAWVKLQNVAYTIQRASSSCDDVSYLCLDGTKLPINSTEPCIWISRPWPVILTRKSTQEKVIALINHINNATLGDGESWEYAVRYVLGNTLQPIFSIDPISPTDYLKKGFINAIEKKTCRASGQDTVIKVCVQHNKTVEKCDLMTKVANIYSIDPEFKCILSEDCMRSVASGKTDIYITSIENLKTVYECKDLKTIMYQTSDDYTELRHSAAVVLNNSAIRSFEDLKGKKACFTRYNGLGWNSMLMALNENASTLDVCDGFKAITEFFSDVCIIDHRNSDPVRGCFESDDPFQPFSSLHMNEAEGLRCLVDGGGDVAFVDQNYIGKYLEENRHSLWANNYDANNFRFICPTERAIDSDCYLYTATFGMVLVRSNISTEREEEITSAFLILSSLLGEKIDFNYYEPKILKIFTRYYHEKYVLFESSADQLDIADQYLTRAKFQLKNVYEKELKNLVDTCEQRKYRTNNTSSSLMVISRPVILSLVSVLISIYNLL